MSCKSFLIYQAFSVSLETNEHAVLTFVLFLQLKIRITCEPNSLNVSVLNTGTEIFTF